MKREKKLMESVEKKCDSVLLFSSSSQPDMNVEYYSGVDALVASGVWHYEFRKAPVLLLSDAEHGAKCRKIGVSKKGDVFRHLRKSRAKRIGINYGKMSHNAMLLLRKELKGRRFVDIGKELAQIRSVKEKGEIECIKKACFHTRKAMKIAEAEVLKGKKESEVMAEVAGYYNRKALKHSFDTIVASGKNGMHVHSYPTLKKIGKKDMVIVDTGCRVGNYCADMTRTFCAKPSKRQKEVMWLVAEASLLARKNCMPGMEAGELYREVNDFFGKNAKCWKYGLGHGVGLDIHENPGLSPDSKEKLVEGMVFTIEPGLAVPSVGGARVEHTGILTRKGYKIL